MRRNRLIAMVALWLLALGPATAQSDGRIEGRVTKQDGKGIGGVTVVVSELGAVEITDNDGSFVFEDVPPGTYNLSYSLGDNADSQTVTVTSGATAQADKVVDWDYSFAETITVFSASRRRERIVEAPAAVTQIDEEQIEREGSHGQLPKLLEFSPGVEATQSGVYDYNFNTRGFNSSLNRRVQVLVDGRDPSVPFLASQEWVTVSQYMNDLSSAELVRGPSSALYGANAFNGVLNLVTKSPRDSAGGELRLTGGELSTQKIEFRWAGPVGGEWYFKLNGSYLQGDDFSVDRNVTTEYAGLPREVRPRVVDENEVTFGNLRLDKYFANGDFIAIEGGVADAQAPAILTGIGRFSLPSVERFWSRFNYTSDHWNFLAYFNDRDGEEQTSLQSGAQTFLFSQNYKFEFQTNWDWNDGKVRLVAGASHKEEEIDTANPQGIQTLMFQPVESDAQALFAQLDFQIGPKVKLVVAGRYDESTLHDNQFSPKGSLVYSINPNNTLRFSYNEAFQVANYSEFFLQADAAPPVNLSPFEAFCAPFGVSCGFGINRVLAVGNAALDVEEVQSFEIGYTGILGKKAFLTIDYYDSSLENFITDLLPNVGTALGRLNPAFGPYQPPAALPAPVAQALLAALQGALGPTFFALSNNFDGRPVIVGASYTNFGAVDTDGIDFGLNYYITPEWRLNVNYSLFDFNVKQDIPGDPLQANAPENSGGIGIAYVGDRFDASLSGRFVDSFEWFAGLFRGTVPSYETFDLTANYHVNDHVTVGINVSNLFDDEHYEAFGGDLISRRALGHVAFRW